MENHIRVAEVLNAMGLSYLHLWKVWEVEEALEISANIFGKNHINSEGPVSNLGAVSLVLEGPIKLLDIMNVT
jgi:hypothetical protein